MRPLLYLCLCLTFLTIAACTNPVPEPTSDIPATVTAQVQSHLAAIPTDTPAPTYTPYPTPTTAPTATPYPTATPRPTYTLYPTPTPLPTHTPYPTATPRPTYTPYPTPTSEPTATPIPTSTPRPTATPPPTTTPVPAVAWKTVSDDAGTYTIDIPERWILDSVEIKENGKSSFTAWQAAHDGRATISISASYSEYGWRDDSETASKTAFNERVADTDTVAMREPEKFFDGWNYLVETLSGEDNCAFRAYQYREVRRKWDFVVEGRICLHFIDTYGDEFAEAVLSFESTSYGRR